MSTKYAVISQPMKGIDPDKVTSQRKKAEAAVRAAGYEPIDTVYEEDFKYDVVSGSIVNPALWHMGLALRMRMFLPGLPQRQTEPLGW